MVAGEEPRQRRKRLTFDEMDPEAQARELERRRKISEGKRGKKRPDLAERNKTPEARARARVVSDDTRKRMSEARTIHGHGRKRGEGRGGTSTYYIWAAMVQRCTNPGNKQWYNYGARGITVCERWLKFENFLSDMGEKPDGLSIDRIDNDRGYEPGNCHWATREQQAANTRKRLISADEVRWVRSNPQLTQKQCADILGCSQPTISKVRRNEGRYKNIT